MKKNIIVMCVAFVMAFVGIVALVNRNANTVSDEELMNNYISENYDFQCEGRLIESDEEDIVFMVYENGKPCTYCTVDREYCNNIYG